MLDGDQPVVQLTPEEKAKIKARKDQLEKELSGGCNFEGRVGRLDYWLAYLLMLASLGCAVAASLGGLLFNWDKHLIGGLAGVPPLAAFVASSLKLQDKAGWAHC